LGFSRDGEATTVQREVSGGMTFKRRYSIEQRFCLSVQRLSVPSPQARGACASKIAVMRNPAPALKFFFCFLKTPGRT
jgi:hypothetical protein